jgi:phospholipase C
MHYTVQHFYVDTTGLVTVKKQPNNVYSITYASQGEFLIRHPGQLNVFPFAYFYLHLLSGGQGTGGSHGTRPVTQQVPLTMSARVFSPDGQAFPVHHVINGFAGDVTLDDLKRFRDLRGVSQGSWRHEVSGSTTITGDMDVTVTQGQATVSIFLDETVPSQSAGPLVYDTISAVGTQVHPFDLFRVGQFRASVRSSDFGLGIIQWSGTLRLKDPDGTVVASSTSSSLDFGVTLQTIDRSRDAAGNVRPWSLEVETTGPAIGLSSTITATVIASARLPTALFQDRIDDLIGDNGNKLSVFGANKNGRALARLTILDPFTAETMDLFNFLKNILKNTAQDPGVDPNSIQPNVTYNIANRSENLDYKETILGQTIDLTLSLDVSSLKADVIKITVGQSQHIQPAVPALTVELDVQGECDVNWGALTLANVSLNNNQIILEVGAKLDSSGDLAIVSWMSDDPIDLNVSTDALLLSGLLTGGITVELLETSIADFIQGEVNDRAIQKFNDIMADIIRQAPRILFILLGANVDLTSLRMDNDAILIEYAAPIEPDPKPRQDYTGVIGRRAFKAGTEWLLFPRSLGDTWATANLSSKIDHIVVVMMENRSFDHVLGYRAALPNIQGEDGLSSDLCAYLMQQGFPVLPLNQSDIPPNAAHLRTRFPVSVGHYLADVAQQLSQKLQPPSGPSINSPQGFVDDFAPRIGSSGLKKEDVLGYYTDTDLALYGFLAENYAYCERYFSAHPGPTLPNRMYSLAGDVQYDRVGEAILDNKFDDTFLLSRALTIFDLLTRRNVSWRVYESFPSVTMLRMFARYAPDNTNIVPIARLEGDIAAGNLPAVTFIEPAMHSAPENDDHPVADMLDGQIFIKRVYDALRSNETAWLKTLLLITYDEHGGFYDHVIPPVADALAAAPVLYNAPGTTFKTDMMIPYGLRVPTFVVSPWVPAGRGPNVTLDHCSILKTILARFCGTGTPFFTDRVIASCTFESFLTETQPRLNEIPPSPPLPSSFAPRRAPGARAIVTKPLSVKAMEQGDVDFHDLTGMVARILGRH